MKSSLKTLALVVLVCFGVFPAVAIAANEEHLEIIVNKGIAFSQAKKDGTIVVYDTVAAFDEHQIAVADCARFKTEHKGAVWCFVSEANKNTFVAQNSNATGNKYIPFAGGRCAYGVSNGNLAPAGDPQTAVLIRFGERPQDVALVLNGNMDVRTNFLRDTQTRTAAARQYLWLARRLGTLIPNEKASQ